MKVRTLSNIKKQKNLLPTDCQKEETRRCSSSRMKTLIRSSDMQEEMSKKESKSEFGEILLCADCMKSNHNLRWVKVLQN